MARGYARAPRQRLRNPRCPPSPVPSSSCQMRRDRVMPSAHEASMTDTIRFDGRILFLTCDPDLMRAQLAGRDIGLRDAQPLRDDVSTDEITPVTTMLSYDERLGRFPYVGFQTNGE